MISFRILNKLEFGQPRFIEFVDAAAELVTGLNKIDLMRLCNEHTWECIANSGPLVITNICVNGEPGIKLEVV